MKKHGFTLAELVITLAVIGVASVLMVPAISNLMPDYNKVKVLNAHANLSNAIAEILDDDSLYYCDDNLQDSNEQISLRCTEQAQGVYAGDANFSGVNKFKNLLADKMGLEVVSAPNNTFIDSEGVVWEISPSGLVFNRNLLVGLPVQRASSLFMPAAYAVNLEGGALQRADFVDLVRDIQNPNLQEAIINIAASGSYNITIDIDGLNQGSNCSYSNNCQKPDRFLFEIDPFGNITPGDFMTQAYLKNPLKMNDKATDKRVARDDFARANAANPFIFGKWAQADRLNDIIKDFDSAQMQDSLIKEGYHFDNEAVLSKDLGALKDRLNQSFEIP